MIGDRGPKRTFWFDGNGCCAEGEKKTFCVFCIFQDDCPKQAINSGLMKNDVYGLAQLSLDSDYYDIRFGEIKNFYRRQIIGKENLLKDFCSLCLVWIMISLFIFSFWVAVVYLLISDGNFFKKIWIDLGLLSAAGFFIIFIFLRVVKDYPAET